MSEELEKQQGNNEKQLGGITGKGFMPGVSGNPVGRLPDTEEKKVEKKVIKELVEKYKESLADALEAISPVLIEKAKDGDIQAIKEINDILIEKAVRKTDITSAGKQIPILGGITQIKEEKDDE